MSIVYLSFDGALEALGESQVVRPLVALAARGFGITLLTLEKPRDLARAPELSARLARAGIRWRHAEFAEQGRFGGNLVRLAKLALDEKRATLLHARSLQAAAAALVVQRTLRARLVFDTRAFWSAQRRAQGSLSGWRFGVALGVERAAYRMADAVVMLTELGVSEVEAGAFGAVRGIVRCIPTLTDERAFTLARRVGEVPALVRDAGLVLGFTGSVNADYLVDESLALWQRVARARPDAVLLALSPHEQALRARFTALGIDTARVVFASAPYADMARWLSWVDWGFLMLRDDPSKRASMPTKLGELLLSGVRPIHHGCNAEVGAWVAKTGTGFSVRLDDLDAAAQRLLSDDFAPLARGRELALQHFSLSHGVKAYAELWTTILSAAAKTR